jgi:hypothetical protein
MGIHDHHASGQRLGFGRQDRRSEVYGHANQLGSERWELVSVFDTNMLEGKTRDVIAVLKRPLAE